MSWKIALTHAFRDFMTFFFADIGARIDWTKRPRFRDKELAAISLGSADGAMVADKLVEVALRDGGVQWVLIHIEVQAQRDAALARRIFDYNYRIFNEHGQPVTSLVVLADADSRWRPRAFHMRAPGTVMGIWFATAKLLDYAARASELEASHNPFAWLTLAHLRTQQARHDPDVLYAAKWQLTKLLYQHGWRKQRIIVLFKVINWMMTLPEQHQQRYWQAVFKLKKEHNMEELNQLEQMLLDRGMQKGLKKGLQKGLEQGLEQGMEQGMEQGRKQGAVALLERQLIRRFGPLPKTVQSKLARASLVQIENWSDVLAEAKSLREVFE